MLNIGVFYTFASVESTSKTLLLKKIMVLYIANGGEWEDSFEPFCWWSFHYNMWVKMNLFYEKAAESFGDESIVASVSIKSPLQVLPQQFTLKDLEEAFKKYGFKSNVRNYLSKLRERGKIIDIGKDRYAQSVSQTVSQ